MLGRSAHHTRHLPLPARPRVGELVHLRLWGSGEGPPGAVVLVRDPPLEEPPLAGGRQELELVVDAELATAAWAPSAGRAPAHRRCCAGSPRRRPRSSPIARRRRATAGC